MSLHERLESSAQRALDSARNACHSLWQPHRLCCSFRICCTFAGRRVFRDFLNHLLNFRSIRGWRNCSLWQRPSKRIVVFRSSSFNICCRFLVVFASTRRLWYTGMRTDLGSSSVATRRNSRLGCPNVPGSVASCRGLSWIESASSAAKTSAETQLQRLSGSLAGALNCQSLRCRLVCTLSTMLV